MAELDVTIECPDCPPSAPCLVADFSFSREYDGCTINFADLSEGPPTSWEWDFGDGTVSYDQNPVHAYYIPGT